MRFRQHRSTLNESMMTMIELSDREALVERCRQISSANFIEFDPSALKVKAHFLEPDTRIGWDKTYIVIIEGLGVVGYTDTPC